MNDKNILYIIRGIPGAGKSTLAKSLGFPFFEADNYQYINGEYKFDPKKIGFAHNSCQRDVENAMIGGEQKIAVSNTSTTEKELEPYYNLAKKYNYTVFSLIVENRHGETDIHEVPIEKKLEMANKLKNSIKLI